VLKVLAEIGAAGIPQILVLNKSNRLEPGAADATVLRERLLGHGGEHAAIRTAAVSALTGRRDRPGSWPPSTTCCPSIRSPAPRSKPPPPASGATLAMLHEFGRVIDVRYEASGRSSKPMPESMHGAASASAWRDRSPHFSPVFCPRRARSGRVSLRLLTLRKVLSRYASARLAARLVCAACSRAWRRNLGRKAGWRIHRTVEKPVKNVSAVREDTEKTITCAFLNQFAAPVQST
jgi:hypothetical protein